MTDEDQIAQLGEVVRKEVGAPHILINNAGINIRKALVEISPRPNGGRFWTPI